MKDDLDKEPMKQTQTKNITFLLITAFIFGTAFVAQRVGMDYVPPFTFSAVRFILGGLVLVPVVLVLRAMSGASKRPDAGEVLRNTIIGGALCGFVIFVASNLQQYGVKYTTVGKTGFLTALYIIFVPLIGIFMKKRAGLKLWVSVAIAVVGLYILCMTEGFYLSRGDTLVFLCAIVYAVHILVIDRFVSKVDGVMMSCIQFFIAGILSFLCMLFVDTLPTWGILLDARVPILYAGVLSCGVAYTLQILGQKEMNPTVASLILSLEAVIAVIAAWIILHQTMTLREMLGAALMFSAIILAQLPERRRREAEQAPCAL